MTLPVIFFSFALNDVLMDREIQLWWIASSWINELNAIHLHSINSGHLLLHYLIHSRGRILWDADEGLHYWRLACCLMIHCYSSGKAGPNYHLSIQSCSGWTARLRATCGQRSATHSIIQWQSCGANRWTDGTSSDRNFKF